MPPFDPSLPAPETESNVSSVLNTEGIKRSVNTEEFKALNTEEIIRLIKHANARNFHPVVVFGGSLSGKTAMIMSILRYIFTQPSGVTLKLDATFFPEDFSARDEFIRKARSYLEELLQNFKEGKIQKTNVFRPIFIPVQIVADRPLEGLDDDMRIVLVDGMGEWFEADVSKRGSDGSWVRDFPLEVKVLLSTEIFESISVIFVSPYTVDQSGAVPPNKVISGLSSVIQKYKSERINEAKDWNLFLFTKWDCATKTGYSREKNIWDPDPEYLTRELRSRARDAWATYYSAAKVNEKRCYFMQYVSLLGENAELTQTLPPVGSKNEKILNHYSKIIINWIYGNAVESVTSQRPSLFPEADAFVNLKMPFYDRILGWISGAKQW